MIEAALDFLRQRLERHLQEKLGHTHTPQSDRVVFPVHNDRDTVTFTLDAVSLMLVNIEQERIMRADDPYLRREPADRLPKTVRPDLHLDLTVLCVAHFNNYQTGLKHLSEVIRCFQAEPIFACPAESAATSECPDASKRDTSTPGAGTSAVTAADTLPEGIDRLTLELLTLPMQQQNELWGLLRTAYRPCVIYRVRMALFQSDRTVPTPIEKLQVQLQLRHKSEREADETADPEQTQP